MRTFFAELKLRNVFKVGAAYAIVAWLLIQIAETVLPTFETPNWVLQTIIFIIILGFPLALVFAWAFELTPEGIKPVKSAALSESNTKYTSRKPDLIIGSVLVFVITVFLFVKYFPEEQRLPEIEQTASTTALTNKEISADTTDLDVIGNQQPVYMNVSLPPGVSVTRGTGLAGSSLAISPNGRMLVIAGTEEESERLYLRSLDRFEVTPMAGTRGGLGGGLSPFFSPDGAWIGFFADGRLKRIPSKGGTAVNIVVVPGYPAGASWGPDNHIVFGAGARSGLFVVDPGGGRAEPFTTLQEGEYSHRHPEYLPDGSVLLFDSGDWIHALNLESGERLPLVEGSNPHYLTTGHLVFTRGTSLLAAQFDTIGLKLTSPPVSLADVLGGLHFTVSRNGTLAYVPALNAHTLVLAGADGFEKIITEQRRMFQNPQFSPDGRFIAVATTRRTSEMADIWVHDVENGNASRLTFDGGRAPVWSPNGSDITYSHINELQSIIRLPQELQPENNGTSLQSGKQQGIYMKPVDGRGNAELLLTVEEFHWLVGWTPDARTLLYGKLEGERDDGSSPSSIMALTDGKSRYIVEPGDVWGGRLSPDGRWLAYYSRESGRFEVYVIPYPEGETRWLIAEDGARDPSWSPDGSEIYYRSGNRLMAAKIDTMSGIRVMSRRIVVEPFLPPLYDDYDIHPDGRTLVLVRSAGNREVRDVNMVLNWFTELNNLIPQER